MGLPKLSSLSRLSSLLAWFAKANLGGSDEWHYMPTYYPVHIPFEKNII